MNSFLIPVCVFLACFVAACDLASNEVPSNGLAQQTIQAAPLVVPSPVPFTYQAQRYTPSSELDPFNAQRLVLAQKKEWHSAAGQGGLLALELKRNKDHLEAFALESITLVGSMSVQGRQVALVKVDGLLYPVQRGSHLGQNFGRVVAINEGSLSLRELVQDPTGKWTERKVQLVLPERLK
jgi:type IV pilus assembly protein PilP